MTTTTYAGPDEWTAVRRRLNESRHELADVASRLYPSHPRVAGTSLLGASLWEAETPISLDKVALRWTGDPSPPTVDGTGPETEHLRSIDSAGGRLATYADTIDALARPAVFEDRPAYRLLLADLRSPTPHLTFGPGHYFGGVNTGEAAAHELAAMSDHHEVIDLSELPLRAAVGDPCALGRRPAVPAISTLSIRYDRSRQRASFVLHWRDPSKVAHGGGLYQVMPVGVFQPIEATAASHASDFSLWRSMIREYSEEFLGSSESYVLSDSAFDYERWPFFQSMTAARNQGHVRAYVLGLGVDPLTWATDLLTAVVFDSTYFDEHFHGLLPTNAEGVVVNDAGIVGTSFDPANVRPLIDGTKPMQAAGAATLALADRHREYLLGNWSR